MRRISLLALCFVLLSGCASFKKAQEPEENFVAYAELGISAKDEHGSVIVNKLNKDFPAELSGVKPGDVIVSVDGGIIKSGKELWDVMRDKRPGIAYSIVINRNGTIIKFEIEPRMTKYRPSGIKTLGLLLDNKKMSLAVIVSEVKNSFPSVPKDWADSIRNNIQSDHEGLFLSAYGTSENFSIVDRSRLKQILDEFQFRQVGFVSDKLRTKIGEMTGATHILDISFSRFQGRYSSYDDIMNARLIEIESGKVLAVDQIITHN
jgi:membrane-associated protease RseP (regulator of RpoE activity)